MKKDLSFSIFIIILVFSLANSGLAQEGSDPGQPDTLYLTAGPPCSADGDTLFFPEGGGLARIHLNIWNDNSIEKMYVPLVESISGPPGCAFMDPDENNGALDPICFQGSRVEHWATKIMHLSLYPPQLYYWASDISAPPMPPGNGLFASMIYTVSDTGTICVDTVFFPPAGVLSFIDTDFVSYIPQFVSNCFYLAPYICCDSNSDSLVDVQDVVWLISYLFKSGPEPINWCDANCDAKSDVSDVVYLISYLFRSGPPPRDPDDDGEPNC